DPQARPPPRRRPRRPARHRLRPHHPAPGPGRGKRRRRGAALRGGRRHGGRPAGRREPWLRHRPVRGPGGADRRRHGRGARHHDHGPAHRRDAARRPARRARLGAGGRALGLDLHRRVRAGSRRPPRRPPRHHALEVRRGLPKALPRGRPRRGRPLHRRRAGAHLGRPQRGDRPVPPPGTARPRHGGRQRGGAAHGRAAVARRRTGAVHRARRPPGCRRDDRRRACVGRGPPRRSAGRRHPRAPCLDERADLHPPLPRGDGPLPRRLGGPAARPPRPPPPRGERPERRRGGHPRRDGHVRVPAPAPPRQRRGVAVGLPAHVPGHPPRRGRRTVTVRL
ncbi:MAG: Transcriptional regulator, AraC family, partial [uncultured Nocardioides sp.]